MSDCLFCKISNKEIPSDFIYESDSVLAFNDINPQAPTHVLIIPRKHIATLNDLKSEDRELVGEMHMVAQQIAVEHNLSESGYRTVFNCNGHGQQTVFHIHLHLIGERQMTWPPG